LALITFEDPMSANTDHYPSAFISYARGDDAHQKWIKEFAKRLRADGIDVTLDQWHLVLGDQLPLFMECGVRDNDFVIIVCTPQYKAKSEARAGGVGYEGTIITAEVAIKQNHRKFIPVLRFGEWSDAAPSWLHGKLYVDLRGEPYPESMYKDLLVTLRRSREEAPPVGKPARPRTRPQMVSAKTNDRSGWWTRAKSLLIGPKSASVDTKKREQLEKLIGTFDPREREAVEYIRWIKKGILTDYTERVRSEQRQPHPSLQGIEIAFESFIEFLDAYRRLKNYLRATNRKSIETRMEKEKNTLLQLDQTNGDSPYLELLRKQLSSIDNIERRINRIETQLKLIEEFFTLMQGHGAILRVGGRSSSFEKLLETDLEVVLTQITTTKESLEEEEGLPNPNIPSGMQE
jgi:TIR domain